MLEPLQNFRSRKQNKTIKYSIVEYWLPGITMVAGGVIWSN